MSVDTALAEWMSVKRGVKTASKVHPNRQLQGVLVLRHWLTGALVSPCYSLGLNSDVCVPLAFWLRSICLALVCFELGRTQRTLDTRSGGNRHLISRFLFKSTYDSTGRGSEIEWAMQLKAKLRDAEICEGWINAKHILKSLIVTIINKIKKIIIDLVSAN